MKNYPSLMNARIVIRKKKRKLQAPKPKKTAFVKFFESLQNRGPITNSLYEKWTANVRSEMEEYGTWPKPDEEAALEFIAEYVSRLQRQFWIMHPDFDWYHTDLCHSANRLALRSDLQIYRMIFLKIRQWGMRNHAYQLGWFTYIRSPKFTKVIDFRRRWSIDSSGILISPYKFKVKNPLRKYS